MVDIALDTPGVLGAQLSGAGLGGCMMVLVKQDAATSFIERINAGYYEPAGLDPAALPITPITGSGPLSMP
jgi:N-acetylgalactosamine kinase